MKKIWVIASVLLFIGGCKNENANPVHCSMKTFVHTNGASYDSSVLEFLTDSIINTTYYGNGSIYRMSYVKSGNNYNFTFRQTAPSNSILNHGTIQLSAYGYADTTYRFAGTGAVLNYVDKFIFDGSGHVIKSTDKYIGVSTYSNISTYYYNGFGNIDYSRYLFYNFNTATTENNDSIVYTYYMDKDNLSPIEYAEQFLYGGTLSTNLVHTETYYDYLNSNAVRRTINYNYTLNSNGYVTTYTKTNTVIYPSASVSTDTFRLYYNCP